MKLFKFTFFSIIFASTALSNSYGQEVIPAVEAVQSPAEIEADVLSNIPEESKIEASGNVDINYEQKNLKADKVIYYRAKKSFAAEGNITLTQPNGDVYYGEKADVAEDLNSAEITKLKGTLADGSRFASSRGTRENEDLMHLFDAIFTPCKICKDGKPTSPLWDIRADKVTFDDVAERVYYENAYVDFMGVPVAYSPTFSHPTPDAKRKSGFLVPSFSNIGNLGFTVKTPYYYNIASNMDATIAPIFTTEQGGVLSGEFRHLTNYGKYEFSGSITNPHEISPSGARLDDREIRGHIEGAGQFILEEDVTLGFYGKRASDDTYLQRYKFGNEDLLTSEAYVRQIKERNYHAIRTITFQGLAAEDDPDTTPYALPLVESHFESDPQWNGSRFTLDSNALLLEREEGSGERRLSTKAGWKLPYLSEGGHVFELASSVRADVYDVEDVPNAVNPLTDSDGISGRIIPEIQGNWSLPLINNASEDSMFESTSMIIEPVVMVIASPNGGNPDKIPNEDSQESELSDVNLFSANHFTGLDRVESGLRTNYGVRGGLYREGGGEVNFLFGQNYRAKKDSAFTEESGLNDNFSDYVGKIAVSDQEHVELAYRFRMDKDNAEMRRNELGAGLNLDPVALDMNYVVLDEEDGTFDRHEILANTGVKLNKYWTWNTSGRRDLDDDGNWIHVGSGLNYLDECIGISTTVQREFTRDRDIEPNTSVLFQISFKHLG